MLKIAVERLPFLGNLASKPSCSPLRGTIVLAALFGKGNLMRVLLVFLFIKKLLFMMKMSAGSYDSIGAAFSNI